MTAIFTSNTPLTRFGQRTGMVPLDNTRAGAVDIRLSCRSARQDDFAKRPILDQMTQGFARLAEGIDPLDDRLDGSADYQWDYVPPRCGDRGRRLGKQGEAGHPRTLPDQVRHMMWF